VVLTGCVLYTACIHFVISGKIKFKITIVERNKSIQFIYLLNKYLLNICACAKHCSGTWDISVNKTENI